MEKIFTAMEIWPSPLGPRAHYLDVARDSVRWGRRVALYQLLHFRGAGHHLRTVTCHYWWTTHSAFCPCDNTTEQTPRHWWFECEATAAARQRFLQWYESKKGPTARRSFEAMDARRRWDTVMGWLDGNGEWDEEEEGEMLHGVLRFVGDVYVGRAKP